jgi:hypothetical protein
MSATPNVPVPSGKNDTGDFDTFKQFARQVLSVPHSQIKAQLDAEKAALALKRKKQKRAKTRVSRASDAASKTS